jgi:hypothetical protein
MHTNSNASQRQREQHDYGTSQGICRHGFSPVGDGGYRFGFPAGARENEIALQRVRPKWSFGYCRARDLLSHFCVAWAEAITMRRVLKPGDHTRQSFLT